MNTPNHVTTASSMRRPLAITLLFLSPMLAITSCGGDTGAGSPGALESWTLSEEPIVAIGGADEREGYLLHRVVGATRLGDGRIVVANAGSLQLRYYDPEGTHLFDAGEGGRGTGGAATAPRPLHPSCRRLDPRGFLSVRIHSIRT